MIGGSRLMMVAAAVAAFVLAASGPAARAAATDPAEVQIESFDNALIDVMKQGKSLGITGRDRKLEPVVQRIFDTPTMIRFAVGPGWSQIPAAQQQALTDAFERLTVASYARNFDSYSGQKFVVNPNVVTRGPDKVVQTQLITPGEAPVTIAYRMRQIGGTWKVIDVFYNGAISQLTTRRSDFATILASGGASALVAHLNGLVDKQLK
jgi:phospholipid transport system substrate-binding protein